MTLLAFLLALALLVTVHEWGHYRAAVACGVKVISFSIGFGKPLLRWKSSHPPIGQETEFMISLVPLGGYVKMLDEADGDVSPSEVAMAFNRQPLWARAVIVSAGPLANILLAVCLYAVTFWIGQYETEATLAAPIVGSVADEVGLKSGDTVLRVGLSTDELVVVESIERLRWWIQQQNHSSVWLEIRSQGQHDVHLARVPSVSDAELRKQEHNGWAARGLTSAWSRAVLGHVQAGSVADRAGLQPRDEIRRINGRIISDAAELRQIVRDLGSLQQPLSQIWEIYRSGVGILHLEVMPEKVIEKGRTVGRIGVQVGEPPVKVWVQYGFFDGLVESVNQTEEVIALTLTMLGRLVTGNASLDHLSGPLVMADYAGRSANMGLSAYLGFLAMVSVSIGVFNLLPFPVLDGGHLLYYLYEACTGHPPSTQWLDSLQRIGLGALVVLMVFSLFNDAFRLGWLSSVAH